MSRTLKLTHAARDNRDAGADADLVSDSICARTRTRAKSLASAELGSAAIAHRKQREALSKGACDDRFFLGSLWHNGHEYPV